MCGSLHGSSHTDKELAKYVKLEPQAEDKLNKGFINQGEQGEKAKREERLSGRTKREVSELSDVREKTK